VLFLAIAAPAAQAQTFTVTNLSDSGAAGDGSLRGEIAAANANSGPDIVDFASGLSGTITLSGNGLRVTDPLDLEGPGPTQITLAQSSPNRVIHINLSSPGAVTIAGLHIADGTAPNSGNHANYGGDVLNDPSDGGGIESFGAPLTLRSSAVSGNHAVVAGGVETGGSAGFTIQSSTISGNSAEFTGGLGGSLEEGALGLVEDSTISANTARDEDGGAMVYASKSGQFTMRNSTIAGNIVGSESIGDGGGLSLGTDATGTISIQSSTIAGNHAGGAAPLGGGGGILATLAKAEHVSLQNTIVAGNSATNGAPDIKGAVSAAFSLIGNPAGATLTEAVPGSDLLGADPQLGPLQDNGGTTQTMAVSATSPAINKGSAFGSSTDQRGQMRPVAYPGIADSAAPGADGADIGAFELELPPLPSNRFTFGKVKLNKKKGTATVQVVVPDAGEVILASTKTVKKDSKVASAATTLKLTIKAKGRALRSLRKMGRVKVKANFTFTPNGGEAASQVKSLRLIRKHPHQKRR
jgi:hypothetical protein